MKSNRHEMDMSSGPLFKNLFLFALPIMAMSILQLLFNTTNMVVVGQFTGSKALAAVGSSGALINLVLTLFLNLSVGTSVAVAQMIGAQQYQNVSKVVHTSVAISIIAGFIVMTVGLVLSKPMLILMGTPEDILDLATLYIKIYFVGVPASMIYNFCAAILRAIGDSRRPMYYLVIAGIVNVILNLFFVIVLDMSIAGVAWATVISQYIALSLIAICMCQSDSIIRFSPRKLHIDKTQFWKIIKIGLPAGLQGFLFSVSNVLIQSGINSFGSSMVAASSASSNVENFVGTAMNAYYTAAITFTSQNMGAKKYDRIDTVAKVSTVLIFITWIVIGGSVMLFAKPIISIFTSEPEVIEMGIMRLNVMMIVYFTCGVMNVFPGLTRGMGYSVLPMICTLVGTCLLRIVWLNTVFVWYHTEVVLFACYPITWAIAGIGQVACFFYARKKIRKNDFIPEAVSNFS